MRLKVEEVEGGEDGDDGGRSRDSGPVEGGEDGPVGRDDGSGKRDGINISKGSKMVQEVV